ncbi:MAG: 4-alpha-glucanotransferase, partial [Neglectibacter timonensis]
MAKTWMTRAAGVLLPVSSLPSKYGIGTFGKAAYKWVDFLAEAGQKYWQVLPLGPTSYGDSPYQSFSAFAGNPYFVDLEFLCEQGLLKKGRCKKVKWGESKTQVDYGTIYEHREKVLRKAFSNFTDKKALEKFRKKNAGWVEDYALYMAVKAQMGLRAWNEWEEDIRMRRPEALKKWKAKCAEDIEYHIFVQYLFFEQWTKLKKYANEKGISIIGDAPIYVAMDSADVWANPGLFQLDENNVPTEVAGCPPDAFSEDGQLWGNPLYRWDEMEKDGFQWWIKRLKANLTLVDVLRIDHFRGLESYYAIPYGDETARNGRWRQGPGMAFVGAVNKALGNANIIAEDLGYLTPAVKRLLKSSGYPGMKVLEFAFDSREESDYMPHNYQNHCVVYTGTHDN